MSLAVLGLVAGWSAAEAAIFFLVADIPISWIAVRSGTRAALLAAAVAALASVAGTLALWAWVAHDPGGAGATLAGLPGIDDRLVASAAARYHDGIGAVLAGSFAGTPFKLFALEAAKTPGVGFLLLSPLLRLPRFALIALLVGGVSHGLGRWLGMRQRLMLLIAAWVAFYAFYFTMMPR